MFAFMNGFEPTFTNNLPKIFKYFVTFKSIFYNKIAKICYISTPHLSNNNVNSKNDVLSTTYYGRYFEFELKISKISYNLPKIIFEFGP